MIGKLRLRSKNSQNPLLLSDRLEICPVARLPPDCSMERRTSRSRWVAFVLLEPFNRTKNLVNHLDDKYLLKLSLQWIKS